MPAGITNSTTATAGTNAQAAQYNAIRDDIQSGWIDPVETWTYLSATSITVPTDATVKYAVGDRIRLKQGGGYLYFYIIGVTATVLTITGGTDYTLANAGITNNFLSKWAAPVGFPFWFNYTPTYTGFSANPTNTLSKFSILGRQCTVIHAEGNSGTSNLTTFSIDAPITAAAGVNKQPVESFQAQDGGVGLATPGMAIITSGSSTITLYKDFSAATWTASGGKACVSLTFIYDI